MALEDIVKKAVKIDGVLGTAVYEMLCSLESTEERCEVDFPKDIHKFLYKALEKMKALVDEDRKAEILKLPLYQREFFNAIEEAGLEPLPSFLSNGDWVDESWHNNEMPSWWNEKLGVVLWVNFKDKKFRGDADEPSYMLTKEDRATREDLNMCLKLELMDLEALVKNW